MLFEFFSRRIGTGGASDNFDILTDGQRRFSIRGTAPAIEGRPATATPSAPVEVGAGVLFFRNDGSGKAQLCVRFPSGAVQILATEP